MSHLLHGEVDLVPPLELTPMKIFYEEHAGRKRLRLVAAKTRQLMLPQPEIPDHVDEQYPGIHYQTLFQGGGFSLNLFESIDVLKRLVKGCRIVYSLWRAQPIQKEQTMSDNLRQYRAIRAALIPGYPG